MDFGINPHVDDAAWSNTDCIRQGVNMAAGHNEFAECQHAVIPITNSSISYEKSLRETEVWTHDPSDYALGITRDACGDDSRTTIKAGNLTGRAWGGYSDVVVEPGADGLATGRETAVINDGSDQPLLDTPTSKYGHLVAAKGSQPLTAAFYAIASGKYHLGFPMRTDAFTNHPDDAYLVLYQEGSNTPLFRVHPKTGAVTHIAGRPVLIRRINGFDCLTLA